jgi:hypothetical protein
MLLNKIKHLFLKLIWLARNKKYLVKEGQLIFKKKLKICLKIY